MSDAEPLAGATSAVVFDLKLLTRFNDQGPQAVILAETGAAQLVLLGMRAGQRLRDVQTASQNIVQCLRGRAALILGDTAPQELRAGLVTLVEAGARHSLLARTDCVLLLTLTPSPERRAPAHDLLADLDPLVKRAE